MDQPLVVGVDGSESSLLVVAARRGPDAIGLQLGRVTHTVLHHAACAVAVVPERM
ncbi:universal stress protein [Streptomyces sp. NPDC048696]|uniref:universal stress protein n=1 Tax=Streptomyces sp. NPDC048696 TaxID=3365585 RepID=UPI00371184E7